MFFHQKDEDAGNRYGALANGFGISTVYVTFVTDLRSRFATPICLLPRLVQWIKFAMKRGICLSQTSLQDSGFRHSTSMIA